MESVWRKEGEKRTSKSNKQTDVKARNKLDRSHLQPLHTGRGGGGRERAKDSEGPCMRD